MRRSRTCVRKASCLNAPPPCLVFGYVADEMRRLQAETGSIAEGEAVEDVPHSFTRMRWIVAHRLPFVRPLLAQQAL